MARRTHRYSLLSQRLDLSAFIAYFLGAVVPLVALGWVIEGYALPSAASDVKRLALVGLMLSIGVLSLGSFFLLRRLMHQSLARMQTDNRRLATLLDLTEHVAGAGHADEVAGKVAACAMNLADAPVAYAFLRGAKPDEPALPVGMAGRSAEALYEGHRKAIDSMARLCISNQRPGLVSGDARTATAGEPAAGAALPFVQGTECMGALVVVHTEPGRVFDGSQVSSLSTLAGLAGVAFHNADLQEAQKNFFAHMTDILVTALDAHLEVQSGHSRRVAHFANVIGRRLGFDDDRLQRLHFASLLHDIGMLRISGAYKTNRNACMQHATLGFRMLDRIRLWEDLAPFVLHHHEFWDGGGYPEGLAGEDIPLEARVIGLAEAFDSMTSESSYKEAVPVEEALRRIEDCAGTQFDPQLARTFLDLVREGAVRLEI